MRFVFLFRMVPIVTVISVAALVSAAEPGLIAHWKLAGDATDSSGRGRNAVRHNADLRIDSFDGLGEFLEVSDSAVFDFGNADFSIALRVQAEACVNDAFGDLVSKFDPVTRRGFVLTIGGNTSGYNAQSDVRQLFFGTDNGTAGKWVDCGRPSGKTHISDSLTVFNGELYAAICDGETEEDWAHVYKYKGGKNWEDCGRLGTQKTRGVLPMIVHNGELYAATTNAHPSSTTEIDKHDPGRVYRYLGGTGWEDLGQPGDSHRQNAMASFAGKLYISGGVNRLKPGFIYVYDGNKEWREVGCFKGLPHTMCVHNDRLYTAYPQGEVYAFDGEHWDRLGNPLGSLADCNQLHAMGVYQGELYVGSWPLGKMSVLRDGKWMDLGRLGDATEIVGVNSYNGCLYVGTIPRAEVFRFDGRDHWTSVGRLFDPPGFASLLVGQSGDGVKDWSRASSLAVYDGKLFASTATCYRTRMVEPMPNEVRGKVFSFSTGNAVSYDRDLGSVWRDIAAVREGKRLRLYVDGDQVSVREGEVIDVSNDAPLRIGFGPQSHFRGKMENVRLYDRALSADDVRSLRKR